MGKAINRSGGRLSPLFTWRGAICDSPLPSTARLVAFVLSLHMNERGGSCWPGVERLARETGLSERSVRQQISLLREKGYLAVTERSGKTHLYEAQVPLHDVPPSDPPPLHDVQDTPEPPAPEGVKEDVHTLKGVLENPSTKKKRDLVWEALDEAFHPSTPSERSNVGKTERELRRAWVYTGQPDEDAALAAEIRRRLAAYWPGLTKTPSALRQHWSELGRMADDREASDRPPGGLITREWMLAKNGPCQTCDGSGAKGDIPFTCPDCGGTGIEGWVH